MNITSSNILNSIFSIDGFVSIWIPTIIGAIFGSIIENFIDDRLIPITGGVGAFIGFFIGLITKLM